MQQKPSRKFFGLNNFQQPAECLQAMDRHRAPQLGRKPKLPDKCFLLLRRIKILDPPIQTNLTNRRGLPSQQQLQLFPPLFARLIHIPRMQPIRRNHPLMFLRQLTHRRPVLWSSPIHHRIPDRERLHFSNHLQFTRQTRVLKMIVRVEYWKSAAHFFTCSAANPRILSHSRDKPFRRFGDRCCVIPTVLRKAGSFCRISAGGCPL